jgi:hypothetical protein
MGYRQSRHPKLEHEDSGEVAVAVVIEGGHIPELDT